MSSEPEQTTSEASAAPALSTDRPLQQAGELLLPWTKKSDLPEPGRLDLSIEAGDLLAAVKAILDARWGYLIAITGLDLGKAGQFEVLYQFGQGAAVLTLRVAIPHDAASVPTVCRLIPSASFFERELAEMFGITVEGTPDPSKLFLPDDWPNGAFPLRKDFTAPALPKEATPETA
ncbi:MAG: NADH-quinone oxidoreductase subunit C [Anaerolineae bacterium]|nr:NADH-quinone oxidoreductase subunit C [Anaerolineae bacterium]